MGTRPRFQFLALIALLFVSALAQAQFTLVSGTITDPNGLAYANGTITPVLVSSSSPVFTATNLPYTPPTGAVGLNASGSFTFQLASNGSLTPGGSTWSFIVNCGAGCVPPAGGKGPVTFTLTGITLAGATQNISAQLQAIAPALSTGPGGGGGTFPIATTATESVNTVTLTTVSGTFPAAYVTGVTVSVIGCSVAGYNIAALITGGGAGTATLTYTDPTGALGPASGCTANAIVGSTTPGFGSVLAGTNPNALLVSGTLGPTGGGTLSANNITGLVATNFLGINGSGTPITSPCPAGQILVGNVSSIAVCQPLTGDSTITNAALMKNVGLNGVSLGGLATGPLCNTVGTGIPFICGAGNFPVLNQNTTGTASNLSGTPLLPNGTTAATQAHGDGSAQLATDAFVLSNSAGALSALSGAVQALPVSGGVLGNLNPSAIYQDALQYDATPLAPTTRCQDLLTAENNSINGNFAVPTQGLGLSTGTPFFCPINMFANSRSGPVYLPSAVIQQGASDVTPSTSVTNSGPAQFFGTGHSGNCGSNGKCATWFQGQVGMEFAQYGPAATVAGTTVTLTPYSAQVIGTIANTAWPGLNFGMYDPTTGVHTTDLITAVTCNTAANGFPCANGASADQLSLSASWSGNASGGFYLSTPGTITVSGTAVVGSGTSFNAAWVGVTFSASTASGAGGLCSANTAVCTIASVTDATHLTLSLAWSGTGSSLCSTACNYTLGSMYGPLMGFGQSAQPTQQGWNMQGFTIQGYTPSGGGISSAVGNFECFDQLFGQEGTAVNLIKIQDCGNSWFMAGGGGTMSEGNQAGPYDNMELVEGGSVNPLLLPVGATVSSASTTVCNGACAAYPGKSAYAIFNFSTVPVPMPARGQKMVCSGVANGTNSTVFNGIWQVLDQVSPTAAFVYMATPILAGGQSSTTAGGGTCRFYSGVATLANASTYKGKGMHNVTANPVNFQYGAGDGTSHIANKVDTIDGLPASPNLLVDFDLSGGAANNSGNLYAQASDIGYALGLTGAMHGFSLFNLQNGQGTCSALAVTGNTPAACSPTSSTAGTVFDQFSLLTAVGTGSPSKVGGVSAGCVYGIWGDNGFPVKPTTTWHDAENGNLYPFGANDNGNPDIPIYCFDRDGFPWTNAVANASTPATITNGWNALNGKDGIQETFGGVVTVSISPKGSGIIHTSQMTQVLTADTAGITATTAATAQTVCSWTTLQPNTTYSFHASGTTTQATAGAGIGIAFQTATTAATNMEGHAQVATGPTAPAYQSSGSLSTTTYSAIYTGSTGTLTTQLPWYVDGSIEVGATAPTAFNIGFFTINAADAVTVKRDSYCSLTP